MLDAITCPLVNGGRGPPGQAMASILDSTVTTLCSHWPLSRSRRDDGTVSQMTDAFRGTLLRETMAHDPLSAEVLKLDPPGRTGCLHNVLVKRVENGRGDPEQWTCMHSSRPYISLHRSESNTIRSPSFVAHAGDVVLEFVSSNLTESCDAGEVERYPPMNIGFHPAPTTFDMTLVVCQLQGPDDFFCLRTAPCT